MNQFYRPDYDTYLFPNYAPLALMPERGEGARLWDTTGKEYVDFAAGIAVSALGHCHPDLIDALTEQANKYWHVSNLIATEPAIKLAKQLVSATFADKVFFANSGAEANEAALKLARRYAFDHFGEDKQEIIAFDQSFHGRTFFTVCVGGQSKYSDGFGPKPGAIRHLPFNDVEAVKAAISDKTCAVILEPIQGEGGVNPATPAFVQAIREQCDAHKALMIFDEIQTGVMRTGDLYRYQGLGIEPDILTSAKGMGGGFPIAAMLARDAVAASLVVGTHGSTYGGNPLGCAVASKVIEIINTDNMRKRVAELSARFVSTLTELNQRYQLFKEIRGFGLLLGCELSSQYADQARDLITAMQDEGLLVLVAGPSVLRLAPPLVMSDEDFDEGMARFEAGIKQFLVN